MERITDTESAEENTTETEKTQMSLGFDVAVTDPDALCTIEKIELLSINDYTVKVTYTYDLNNGVGAQNKYMLLESFTLAQEIVIEDIRIPGAQAILPGESVALFFDIVNPNGVELLSLVINGVTVSVQKISEGVYSGSYISDSDGGKDILGCDSVNYRIFGVSVAQSVDFTSDAVLSILGEVTILELKLDKEYFVDGEKIVATVIFKGFEVV